MSGVEFVPHEVAPPTEQSPVPLADEQPADQAEPARRRLRGLGPRSLTARLVGGAVVLVIVLVATIGTVTYVSLRSFLFTRLDQQVAPVAAGNQGHLAQCLEAGIGRCALGGPGYRSPQTEWVTVLNTAGRPEVSVDDSSDSLKQMRLTTAQGRALAAQPGSTTTLTTTDGIELRVSARPITSPSGDLVVVSGLSTSEVRRTLSKLVVIEVVIGAGAVLLALLATSYGVRFSLRRLRRVTTTAHEVAAELSPSGAGLDRRVDVPDDGTEVGQLAGSMNTLLSAVETQFAARLESEQRLRQFLADASHELRTPLTSIRGYAELARMQRAAGADADDNLSRIESEGTRMSRLVEDLLTLARGDQASAEPARELVDVGELVDDAARDTRAAFPDRTVEARPASDLHVIGDRDQLLRAVRNLMANSAVHTANGRPILVRCAHDGDAVLIQVIDGGPGLPPEEAAHVFERFWRADKARTRARGGSGLGLSIVSSIVAAHGGTVRFDSAVETGSTVTIRLPAVAY